MDKLPQRKKHKIKKNYDYSQAGYYFVTICTKDKKSLFWEVGRPVVASLKDHHYQI